MEVLCSRQRTLSPCCSPYRESERTTHQWGYRQILGHQALNSAECFQDVQESQYFSFGDLSLEGKPVVHLAVVEKKPPVL